MCGFAGFLDRTPWRDEQTLSAIAGGMADTLILRGPDDRGVWVDPAVGYAVGFRRLAIVDLSPEGHQPMRSASERFVIAFNGEIYNHEELRRQLLQETPVKFRGHSDTEVMLAAFEHWGFEKSIRCFAGMFAFALWDRQERTLTLARDRMGEKPLYYGWMGDTFLFGSELKALRTHPQFQAQVNRAALVPYLQHAYIPAPHSIFQNIYKLLPGTFVKIQPGQQSLPAPVAYWSVKHAVEMGQRERIHADGVELGKQLEQVLSKVIGEQMVADVPLGAFLSGGVDSSTIVALMQAQSSRPVKTFTVGFREGDFNEAEFAKRVAQHLGTDHTELYLSPEEALKVIPRLPELYDEPFADSSQIPTFLVARMARQHVTVSLSGDGGDEIFAGYNWYGNTTRFWKYASCLPPAMRDTIGEMLGGALGASVPFLVKKANGMIPHSMRNRFSPERIRKGAEMFRHLDQVEDLHQWLISTHWNFDERVLREEGRLQSHLNDHVAWVKSGSVLEKLQAFDMLTYLPDDILVKVDRASMGVSLESRAPFLDHRVVEFMWQVPPQFKIRQGKTKWLLRQVLYRHVPQEIIERPKQGFTVPLEHWLRDALRPWAESLLEPCLLNQQGFFQVDTVRHIWQEHLSGERNWQNQLWNILMFQAWLEEQGING